MLLLLLACIAGDDAIHRDTRALELDADEAHRTEAEVETILQEQALPSLREADPAVWVTELEALVVLGHERCGLEPQALDVGTYELDCTQGAYQTEMSLEVSESGGLATWRGEVALFQEGQLDGWFNGQLAQEWREGDNGLIVWQVTNLATILLPSDLSEVPDLWDYGFSASWRQSSEGWTHQVKGLAYAPAEADEVPVAVDLHWADDPDCPEPSGELGFRDVDGVWYTAVFDGPEGETDTGAVSCDGCGELWVGSVVSGEVCVDTETIWEVPW